MGTAHHFGHTVPSSYTRGQFGGVAFGGQVDGDLLGKCILASYSDRKRSGVVVWPQSVWNISRTTKNPNHITVQSSFDENQSGLTLSISNFNSNLKSLFSSSSVYMLEADPCFRRLAGLVSIIQSNQRHLIVVDQGAQSVYKICYGWIILILYFCFGFTFKFKVLRF